MSRNATGHISRLIHFIAGTSILRNFTLWEPVKHRTLRISFFLGKKKKFVFSVEQLKGNKSRVQTKKTASPTSMWGKPTETKTRIELVN